MHRCLDAFDQSVHFGAATLREQHGLGAIPPTVGRIGAGLDDTIAAAPASPADHLVGRPLARPAALDGNPRVDRESTTPAHRARSIHLDHGLVHRRRIGGQPDAVLAAFVPRALEIHVTEGQHRQRSNQQQEHRADQRAQGAVPPGTSARPMITSECCGRT